MLSYSDMILHPPRLVLADSAVSSSACCNMVVTVHIA